jgi:hypothetical protein
MDTRRETSRFLVSPWPMVAPWPMATLKPAGVSLCISEWELGEPESKKYHIIVITVNNIPNSGHFEKYYSSYCINMSENRRWNEC